MLIDMSHRILKLLVELLSNILPPVNRSNFYHFMALFVCLSQNISVRSVRTY